MNTNTKNIFKHALIIVNPVSGLGDPKKRRELIKNTAKEVGWIGEYEETTLRKSAGYIAKNAIKKGIKHIVVCGGDGTVMEALVAAVKKPVNVGVVPLGTGNLFARNLDLPLETEKAVKLALTGNAEKIDIGVANGKYFSIVAGMGIDVDMIKDATRELKNKLGFFAYILLQLKI
ncbi:MAG TPA: diacylglycerol kinase family protein [Candidatus Limnocylindrales bacterium]|nr:diacylglycerol kinase family protein [Candidatus Limnocylindrales bacterium]